MRAVVCDKCGQVTPTGLAGKCGTVAVRSDRAGAVDVSAELCGPCLAESAVLIQAFLRTGNVSHETPDVSQTSQEPPGPPDP